MRHTADSVHLDNLKAQLTSAGNARHPEVTIRPYQPLDILAALDLDRDEVRRIQGMDNGQTILVVRQGDDLKLYLADGSVQTYEDFFRLCGESLCTVRALDTTTAPAATAIEGPNKEDSDTATDAATKDRGTQLADQDTSFYVHSGANLAMDLLLQSDQHTGLLATLTDDAAEPGFPLWGVVSLIGSLVGVVILAENNSSGSAPTSVNGPVVLGPPLAAAGLQVNLYDANGNLLQSVNLDSDGRFTADLGDYAGLVVAKLVDTNGDAGADYRDEATNADKDAPDGLLAIGWATAGQALTLAITPLTHFAALQAGFDNVVSADPGQAPTIPAGISESSVNQANTNVAEAFGLSGGNVATDEPVALINADGSSNSAGNDYGAVLTAISGVEATRGTTTLEALEFLFSQLDSNALTTVGQDALKDGASYAEHNNTALGAQAAALVGADDVSPEIIELGNDLPNGYINTETGEITYTFKFSESVTGFSTDDIAVTGGSKGAFSGSGNIYTLVVTANDDSIEPLRVSVSSGAAFDAAGNSNVHEPFHTHSAVDTQTPAAPSVVPSSAIRDFSEERPFVILGKTNDSPTNDYRVTVNGATYEAAVADVAQLLSLGGGINTDIETKTDLLEADVEYWFVALGRDEPISGTLGDFVPGQSYDVSVVSTDAAGNSAEDSTSDEFLYLGPTGTLTVDSQMTNLLTPVISGSTGTGRGLNPNEVLMVQVLGDEYHVPESDEATSFELTNATYEVPVDDQGNWSLNLGSATPVRGTLGTLIERNGIDGIYDVHAQVADAAGRVVNIEQSDNELIIDRTAPYTPTVDSLSTKDLLPVITGAVGKEGGGISGTAERLEVNVNGAIYAVPIDPDGGTWSLDLATAVPIDGELGRFVAGSYEVTATVVDQAQNSATDITENELTIESVLTLVDLENFALPGATQGETAGYPRLSPIGDSSDYYVAWEQTTSRPLSPGQEVNFQNFIQRFNADGTLEGPVASVTPREPYEGTTRLVLAGKSEIAAIGNSGAYVVIAELSEGYVEEPAGATAHQVLMIQVTNADGSVLLKRTLNQGDTGITDTRPQILALGDSGDFVISWQRVTTRHYRVDEITIRTETTEEYLVQKFFADGSALEPVAVGDGVVSTASHLALVGNDGSFALSSLDSDGAFLQLFDADGNLNGRIDGVSGTLGALTLTADGDLVAAWQGRDTDEASADFSVYIQQVNPDGSTTGHARVQLEAIDNTSGTDHDPFIAAIADDGYVVFWRGTAADFSQQIYSQRFNAAGEKVGATALLDTRPVDDAQQLFDLQLHGVVSNGANGSYTVVWSESVGQSDKEFIAIQTFNADGSRLHSEYIHGVRSENFHPVAVESIADEGAVVFWSKQDANGDYPLFVQRFGADGQVVDGVIQSSETGTAYLVKDDIAVNNVTDITALPTNVWRQVDVESNSVALSKNGLVPGDYRIFFVDEAGRFTTPAIPTLTVHDIADQTPPSVAISVDDDVLAPDETSILHFSFSEQVVDFAQQDIDLSGGTLSEFRGDGRDYTAVFTPDVDADGRIAVSVKDQSFTDNSGNFNAGDTNPLYLTLLGQAPSVTITNDFNGETVNQATGNVTFTLTFSEAVTGLKATPGVFGGFDDNITVSGGVIQAFSGSGDTYTLVVTPNSNSTDDIVVSVAENAGRDSLNNGNAAVTVRQAVDTLPPTLTITDNATQATNSAVTFSFEFSEAVSGFDIDDVRVTGGSKGTFIGSGNSYTLVVTPDDNSSQNIGVFVDPNAVTDAVGNPNTQQFSANQPVDTVRPTAIITKTVADSGDIDFTFNFSEAVTGFDIDDVEVTGGSKGTFIGGGNQYVLTVTPTGSADVEVSVAADLAFDAAGNGNLAANAVQTVADNVPPTATLITSGIQQFDAVSPSALSASPKVISLGSSGHYVVAWSGQAMLGADANDVFVQLVDGSGNALASAVRLSVDGLLGEDNAQVQIAAIGTNGAFVAVWSGTDTDGDTSVYVQRFNADGTLNGSQVKLEAPASQFQNDSVPQVAALGTSGAFAVVWQGEDFNLSTFVYLQRFTDAGALDGSIVRLTHAEPSGNPLLGSMSGVYNDNPQIIALDSGSGHSGHLVVWSGSDGSFTDGGIFLQRFAVDGTSAGGMIRLDAPGVTGIDSMPQAVALQNGKFAVTWSGDDSDGDTSVFVQLLNADGTLAHPSAVKLEGTDSRTGFGVRSDESPQIAAVGSNGEYVVAWLGDAADGSAHVYVQRFNADGSATGGSVELEAAALGAGPPQISALNTGEWVVTWQGTDSGGDTSVFVQQFNADGTRTTSSAVIVEPPGLTTGSDYTTRVAFIGNTGQFVVVWDGDNSAGGVSIFVQPFDADGTPVSGLRASSTEVGTVYLVNSNITVNQLSDITSAADNQFNSVTIASANTPTAISTAGLEPGTYHLYAVDQAGNLSDPASTSYTVTPVVLDLDGDGLEYMTLQDSTAHFDFDNDGAAELTAWVSPDDGLLAIDIDGDGVISQRQELAFSDYLQGAKTDLEGLRFFDTNGNGLLDSGDNQWGQFVVWQDVNSDGISDTHELRSLTEYGIASISLQSDEALAVITPDTSVIQYGASHYTLFSDEVFAVGDAAFAFRDVWTGEVLS